MQLTGNLPAPSTSTSAVSRNPAKLPAVLTPQTTTQTSQPSALVSHQPDQSVPYQRMPSQERPPQRKYGHQPLSSLPEQQVVHPSDSMPVTSSLSNSVRSSTNGSSSAGRGSEVSSKPSSKLSLFIPKAGEKDTPRSPGRKCISIKELSWLPWI